MLKKLKLHIQQQFRLHDIYNVEIIVFMAPCD